MLRTFCSNPALGGFGEAATPDAFCQIIKELVDNAVDACVDTSSCSSKKRVRVVIEEFKEDILRVTVTDNGCGMQDIQACVCAFSSSKAHNSATTETQTSGRYGIGLTLCLLHAQRLVPDSCASIQSSVTLQAEWTVVNAVVDTASDTVRCLPKASLPKGSPSESGTAISILVPGGPTASAAWPRLAEYFARFKLSLAMTCSLEVRAPTLSRVPLYIKQVATPSALTSPSKKGIEKAPKRRKKLQENASKKVDSDDDSNGKWRDGLDSDSEQEKSSEDERSEEAASDVDEPVSEERLAIWKATQLFLGGPVDLENVAHAIVPIRAKGAAKGARSKKNKIAVQSGPQLEVDVIVHGPDDDSDECGIEGESEEENDDDSNLEEKKFSNSQAISSASMVLVRMVNKIPLLDSMEAVACGLVQGLASKKRMWNSFGLEVSLKHDPSNVNKLPSFELRDSEQVAPFFKKGAHNLLDDEEVSDLEEGDQLSGDESETNHSVKRTKKAKSRQLLPASARLGNVLVIIQVHAEPTTLPLPTLSKGRLPIDNKAIDDALELGVTKCLQQLQTTNPSLLLTTSELRKAERDARYVPAVALALASIISKSVRAPDPEVLARIRRWGTDPVIPNVVSLSTDDDGDDDDDKTTPSAQRPTNVFQTKDVEELGLLIERRLRFILAEAEKPKPKKTKEEKVSDDEGSQKSQTSSVLVDFDAVDIDWGLLNQDNDDTAKKKSKSSEGESSDGDQEMASGSGNSAAPDNSDYEDWL